MKKILTVVVLFFIILGSSQIGSSYFKESNASDLSNEKPLYMINEVVSNNKERLIPLGAIKAENDTYKVTFHYEITVEKDMDIHTSIKNISLINGMNEETKFEDITLEDLFRFDITVEHKEDVELDEGLFKEGTAGEVLTITVEVMINNLEDFTNYQALNGNTLTFTLLFEALNLDTEIE